MLNRYCSLRTIESAKVPGVKFGQDRSQLALWGAQPLEEAPATEKTALLLRGRFSTAQRAARKKDILRI